MDLMRGIRSSLFLSELYHFIDKIKGEKGTGKEGETDERKNTGH
jgi:hypothetical protein